MPTAIQPGRPRQECVLLALDLFVAFVSTALALALRFGGEIPPLHWLPYLTYLPLVVLWRAMAAHAFGLYDFRHRLTGSEHFFGAVGAATAGVGGGYLFLAWTQLYYAQESNLSRAVVLIDWALLLAWFAISRAALLAILRARSHTINVILAGPASRCDELLAEAGGHTPPMVRFIGAFDVVSACERDGSIEQGLEAAAGSLPIRQIILTAPDLPEKHLAKLMLHCDRSNIDLYLYPELGQALVSTSRLTSLAGIPLVPLNCRLAQGPYGLGKRAIDILTAVIGLVLMLPLLVVAAIAIKLTSNGPVLYLQERAGRFGAPFRMVKFRTMVADAEALTGPVLSNGADPRVTPVGRVLRRYRIDELPQLWNVLTGDMSLVGPRPDRIEFVRQYLIENPIYERRLLVRPGLTGLAQIHGRYDTEYTQKLRYDLIYINSVSLVMDLRILLATAHTVITGRGAV